MWHDPNLNISWLLAFDSAARHLSFTRAAKDLGLTQSAVSHQIRKLETALNAELFERRGRHVVLTDEGHAYHPHVSAALQSLSATTTRLFSRAQRNTVTISCYSPTFAEYWLTPRLSGLMAALPDLEINLIVDYQSSPARPDRDDLVIAYEAVQATGFLPLLQEVLAPVCAPQYLQRQGEDWGRGILIESAGPRLTWPMWRSAAQATCCLDGRVIRVNSQSAALQLARQGCGATLAALAFAKADIRAGRLVEIAPERRLVAKAHGLDLRQLEQARPQAKRVARWLLDSAGQAVPEGAV